MKSISAEERQQSTIRVYFKILLWQSLFYIDAYKNNKIKQVSWQTHLIGALDCREVREKEKPFNSSDSTNHASVRQTPWTDPTSYVLIWSLLRWGFVSEKITLRWRQKLWRFFDRAMILSSSCTKVSVTVLRLCERFELFGNAEQTAENWSVCFTQNTHYNCTVQADYIHCEESASSLAWTTLIFLWLKIFFFFYFWSLFQEFFDFNLICKDCIRCV